MKKSHPLGAAKNQHRGMKRLTRYPTRKLMTILGITVGLFCSLGAPVVHSAVLLMNEGSGTLREWDGAVGVQFTVEGMPLQVTSLGIWDGPNSLFSGSEGDGIEVATDVGLWLDSGGSPLGSVSVAQGTVGTAVDGSTALSAFAAITPITLSANTTYRLAAFYTGGGNTFRDFGGYLSSSAITVPNGVFNTVTSGLTFPGSLVTSNTFASATMQFSVVPIPPAVWLFSSGLLGLIGISMRKKAA